MERAVMAQHHATPCIGLHACADFEHKGLMKHVPSCHTAPQASSSLGPAVPFLPSSSCDSAGNPPCQAMTMGQARVPGHAKDLTFESQQHKGSRSESSTSSAMQRNRRTACSRKYWRLCVAAQPVTPSTASGIVVSTVPSETRSECWAPTIPG